MVVKDIRDVRSVLKSTSVGRAAAEFNLNLMRKRPSAYQPSPAAFAPLLQVRTLGSECGVLPMSGVNDCVVAVHVENLGRHVVEERFKLLRFCCPSKTAGEE